MVGSNGERRKVREPPRHVAPVHAWPEELPSPLVSQWAEGYPVRGRFSVVAVATSVAVLDCLQQYFVGDMYK